MSKQTLGNISYTVEREKRKSVSLHLYSDGRVIVRAPKFLPEGIIHFFLSRKLAWVEKKVFYFLEHPTTILNKKKSSQKQEYLQYKEVTRKHVHEKLSYFNQHYGFSYNQVRIKNTKSRWGSCSLKKNLNFSYKLALLPEHLLDYVVVHELCHLKELNHSRAFWSLVEKVIPDYEKRRKELRGII